MSAGGDVVIGGTGVALDSDAFSEELPLELLTAGAATSVRPGAEEDDGADLGFEDLRSADLGAKSLSVLGDSLRVTILDGLFIFFDRGPDADEIVVVVVDMTGIEVRSILISCV